MDKSYFSENDEDQTELLLYVMNNLYNLFNLNKLEQLSELVDETKIKNLIYEIEPSFDTICSSIKITNGDVNFGIRYSNMVSILNSLENYFMKKSIIDKINFTKHFDLKENIKVNDLLKMDQKNVILLAELFLLMSSVSSKKDFFIDKISECEEKYLNGFLTIIEKYVIFNEPEIQKPSTHNFLRKNSMRTSLLFGITDPIKTMAAVEMMSKKLEEIELEKTSLLKTFNENEREMEENTRKMENQSKLMKEMEIKIMDLERQLEMSKSSNVDIMKAHEETFQDALKIDQFKKQIEDKNLEIEKIHNDHRNQIRNYLDKISQFEKTLSQFEHRNEDYQSILAENEKLKSKNKELYSIKEKLSDFDDLVKKSLKQTNLIDALNQEKTLLLIQNEKMNTEISEEKEKNRYHEMKNKGLMYEIEEMHKYIDGLKSSYDKMKQNGSLNTGIHSILIPEMTKESKSPKNLLEIDRDQIMKERVFHLTNQIEILTNEKINSHKNLKEEINILNESNENSKIQIKCLKNEINVLIQNNSKLINEKENTEISLQKSQNEFNKTIYELEKEIDKLGNLNTFNLCKLNEITELKDDLSKDYETLNENFNETNIQLEKVLNEKKLLIDENIKIENEMKILTEKLKSEIDKKEKLNLQLKVKEKEIEILKKNEIKNSASTNSKKENRTNIKNNKKNNEENNSGNIIKVESTLNNTTNTFPNPTQNSIIIHTGTTGTHSDQLESAILKLGIEMQSIKSSQINKEELMKESNDKIKSLENENKKLTLLIQENLLKYNLEIKQRQEDLDFLKRAYEDQKNKLTREHDLISSNLYEMALQFMTAKNEMTKKPNIHRSTENTLKRFSLDK